MIAKTGAHRGDSKLAVQRGFLRNPSQSQTGATATTGSHSHGFTYRMSYL
jgi:hypothetical protein